MTLFVEILLFLISFNFMGRGSRIQLVLLGVTLIDIIKRRSIIIELKSAVMYCFLISYMVSAVMKGYFSLTFASTHVMCPFMMYYWGREIFEKSIYSEKQLRKEFYIIFAGFFVMGLLSLLYCITNETGSRMEVYSIWGGTANSGIQQTIFFVLPESLILYFMLFGGKFSTKCLGISAGVSSIVNILYFAGRSGFAIILLANTVTLMMFFLQTSANTRRKTTMIGSVMIIAMIIMFNSNVLGVKSIWLDSNMYDRLYVNQYGLESKSRIEMWATGLQELAKNPFNSTFKYAHNFWIDIALEGGIITGVLLVLYSMISLIDVYRMILKNKSISIKTRIFIASLYAGTFAAFMVEPMMQSLPLLTGNLFFMDSAISAYNIRGIEA